MTHKIRTQNWITTHKVLMNEEPQLHVYIYMMGLHLTNIKHLTSACHIIHRIYMQPMQRFHVIRNRCIMHPLWHAIEFPFITALSSPTWISSTIKAVDYLKAALDMPKIFQFFSSHLYIFSLRQSHHGYYYIFLGNC